MLPSYPHATQRACPCPMTPPGLGSPLHHQDKLLIHISLGHGGLEVWALQETQEKLIYQLEEGNRRKGEFRSSLPPHPALWPSSNSPGPKETLYPLLGSLLKLRSLSSPALIPEDVAMKAQGWAHPLQGQIQGSHWVAASGRYSLRSEGTESGFFTEEPLKAEARTSLIQSLTGLSTCPSNQFTPRQSSPEHLVHGRPGPRVGDPRVDEIHPCPLSGAVQQGRRDGKW